MGQEKTMSQEEAVRFLQTYKEETKKTQAAVARELGISEGALSGFLKGSYKTPWTVCEKVAALQRVHEKKKVAPKEPGYVPTSISRTVINAIRYCHIQGKISVVYGDAGIGKTMAARQYLKEDSLAVGITISPTYASITGVNELLAEQLGVRERVARKITSEIVAKLRGSGRVLIIDEAQHLTVRTLNHLRCISDESGVGIALIGNDEVYTKMKGSGRADFAQLFSRIGMRKQVLTSGITREDVEAVFSPYGIDGSALEVLFRICRTSYGLRGAVNVFVNTAAVFQEVTDAGVARVMKDMNIGA
mgnify:CR=1 FL=1